MSSIQQERAPPSAVATAIGFSIIAGITGYFLGQARSIGVFGRSPATKHSSTRAAHADDDSDDDSDASSEDEASDLGELKPFRDNKEECKLVLVVRTDLGMGKGKSATNFLQHYCTACATLHSLSANTQHPAAVARILVELLNKRKLIPIPGKIAAQCSHATLACYKALLRADPAHPLLRQWERLGQAKVALKVDSEDDMLVLQAQAVSLGLCAQVIHDAGRTQIASGSATVLGVGPAPKSKIDEVTGHLRLL